MNIGKIKFKNERQIELSILAEYESHNEEYFKLMEKSVLE